MGRGLRASLGLSLVVIFLWAPASAGAAIITPNTTADQFDTDPANCSLREAVDAADDNSVANAPGCTAGDAAMDTIRLPAGRYELTIPQDNGLAEDVASGDLQHNLALRVEADPATTQPVTIDINQLDRIFQSNGNLEVDGLTLTGGFVDSPGPGIGTTGGAIAASSNNTLTMTDSAVVGNRSDGFGGGINWPGNVSLTNVTISGNTVTESGAGGIGIFSGMANTLTLDHVTVTDNHAVTDGTTSGCNCAGGVDVIAPATAIVHNSIISGNTENSSAVDQPNCEGMFTSNGGNLFGSLAGCTLAPAGTDEVNLAGAGLALLGDYGGTSLTHLVMAGGPAIDQGINPCQATDQRGIPRVAGGPCEAGAYEVIATDMDGDGVLDGGDNCPMAVNARQENNDADMQGDVCDPDDDNDGVADVSDNCDFQANADQVDFDGDGIGNACDPTPGSPPSATPLVTPGENPACATLRAKLKKAKVKAKKRKIRKRLRRLGC